MKRDKMNKTLIAAVTIAIAALIIGIFATRLTHAASAQKNTTTPVLESNSQSAPSNTAANVNANFLTYENSTSGIKIQYPSNWTKETSREGVAFVVLPSGKNDNNNPQQFLAKLNITSIAGIPPNAPLKALADGVVDGYIHLLRNFQIESYTNTTLGGNNAIKIVYSYTGTKNTNFKATDIATINKDRLYVIQYNYEQSPKYQSYLQTLQKMVDSFQITG
jgi:eukaryotic-like serine/threonine-protein kinase